MTLRHLNGTYDSTLFWVTDFPVWDVDPNTTSDKDRQKTDFLREQRRLHSKVSKEPSLGGPLIFNCYKSVNLEIATGLTFFYGFEGPMSALNDVLGHTSRAPYATTLRGSLRSAVGKFEMGGGRRVFVPIAPGDQITELAILKATFNFRDLCVLVRIVFYSSSHLLSLTRSADSHKARR